MMNAIDLNVLVNFGIFLIACITLVIKLIEMTQKKN
ncbi:MAG: hypothetical protein C6W59_16235 [Paenibacillaceae bacterium]|jgi:hypothetical protein|nr:MAG: hypothetical protein C6W59_16235 [Paenibacillaceae bacterium]